MIPLALPLAPSKPHSNIPASTSAGCPVGTALLKKFWARIEALPQNVGEADDEHPLASFAGDPTGRVKAGKDAWEKFDGPLNTLLQKSPHELQSLVRISEKGLNGLCRFLEYLVSYHHVSGYLLEGKISRLMQAMNEV
jgi:hypothetical protein